MYEYIFFLLKYENKSKAKIIYHRNRTEIKKPTKNTMFSCSIKVRKTFFLVGFKFRLLLQNQKL